MDWLKNANDSATPEECVIWPFWTNVDGYGRVKTVGAHRVVCELAHGPAPAGHEAAHICGVRSCVNHHHLRWATPKENSADKAIHGTLLRGVEINTARLTESDVHEIRRLKAAGVPTREITPHFPVNPNQIRRIAARTSWSWLPEQSILTLPLKEATQ